MNRQSFARVTALTAALGLSGCGSLGSIGDSFGSIGSIGSGPFSGGRSADAGDVENVDSRTVVQEVAVGADQTVLVEQPRTRRIFGGGRSSATSDAQVNKYIWAAALDVLGFLPVQSADPFTGVIVTGYGTPPGGGRAYRATIYVTDPALDARTLNISLYTRSGPASTETVRAVENAILTRARQLRATNAKL